MLGFLNDDIVKTSVCNSPNPLQIVDIFTLFSNCEDQRTVKEKEEAHQLNVKITNLRLQCFKLNISSLNDF